MKGLLKVEEEIARVEKGQSWIAESWRGQKEYKVEEMHGDFFS